MLADNTDGRAIVNRNDLAAGMKQIMRDASGYYLLGYTSASAPTDGKFHNIDVRVKRPNVEVRARKGYWAYTPRTSRSATAPPKAGPAPAVSNALNAIAEPTRGRPARFWVGTDRGPAAGQSRVTFVWEADRCRRRRSPGGYRRGRARDADGDDGRRQARLSRPRARRCDDAGTSACGRRRRDQAVAAAAAPPAGASVSFNAPPGSARAPDHGRRCDAARSSTRRPGR